MVTAVREFSLEHYLLERLRHSGMGRENLADLVSIIVSLKNKYGVQPFSVSASGSRPAPTRLTARYMLQSAMLNKLMNLLLDTPRLDEMSFTLTAIRVQHNSNSCLRSATD